MTNVFLVDKFDSIKRIIHFILSNDQPVLPLRKAYTKYRSIAITANSKFYNFHNILPYLFIFIHALFILHIQV